MVMAWIVVVVLAVLFLVVGCGPSDSSKEKKQITDADAKRLAENMAAEQQLLADPSKATPQLMQRLRASVKMSDGLLMVESQSLTRLLYPRSETAMASIPGAITLFVFPRETPWVVNCGIGLTIIFGNPTSGEPEQIDSDGKVWLTNVPIPKQVCEKLSPLIGKEIQAILGGQ
jgi:hypothetical protein